MNIDTVTLECFIAASDTESFTKAAHKVGRTQSAVSQQVLKLEDILKKQLFTRGKTLSLTDEGEIFLSYARRIFALHKEVLDRFKEPDLQGRVRFGLPENFANLYLSDVIADFSRIHPLVLLEAECDLTVNLFTKFKQKKLDLALLKMSCPEDFPNGVDVWSEPLKWVGDKSCLEKGKPIPLILSPSPCVYRSAALKSLEEVGLSWRVVFTSTSHSVISSAVKAGMGITAMPLSMLSKEIQSIDISSLPPLAPTHVSLLKHQKNNSAINSLENFVLKKLNSGV